MFDALSRPNYPHTALGISASEVAAVSLRRAGRGMLDLDRVGIRGIPPGVIRPSFSDENIVDGPAFSQLLRDTAESAGLLGQKRWSVALPANAARTAIVSLEAEPASKKELEEILDWKAEQTFGIPSAEMRVSRQKLKVDHTGKTRYLMSVIKLDVIDEYETHFESLGWKAGLILPRSLAEANWLIRRGSATDSLLLSVSDDGFTALLIRGSEPMIVRTVLCEDAEIDDEVYRLLLFYGDRIVGKGGSSMLERVLIVGDGELRSRFPTIAAEALGSVPRVVDPAEAGLGFIPEDVLFDEIAAPSGLAALARS
jgi:Tfp pilus assembly PilM family ATPase